jgi:hypothetical protein
VYVCVTLCSCLPPTTAGPLLRPVVNNSASFLVEREEVDEIYTLLLQHARRSFKKLGLADVTPAMFIEVSSLPLFTISGVVISTSATAPLNERGFVAMCADGDEGGAPMAH